MAITKAQKVELIKQYADEINQSKSVAILKQFGIPVNTMNAIRKDLARCGSTIVVIKKKLFLKSLEQSDLSNISLEDMSWSVAILCNKEDEFAGLKVIAKNLKEFKKLQATYGFEYLGGWFDKQRKTGEYVKELAELPTKEELIGKLLYMLKYPLQSLTATLDQVAKKQS